MKSEFQKIDKAYREGKKALGKGLPKEANPYKRQEGSKSQSEHTNWARGWIAGCRGMTIKDILKDLGL